MKKTGISPHQCLAILVIILSVSGAAKAHAAPTSPPDAKDAKALTEDNEAQTDSHHLAALNVMRIRGESQRNIDDLILLFKDSLPVSQACYQASVSNYIEDKWNAFAAANGCDSTKVLCNKDTEATKGAVMQSSPNDRNDDGTPSKDRTIASMNSWYIAAHMYDLEHQLNYQLDPENQANSFMPPHQREMEKGELEQKAKNMTVGEKKEQLDEFNSYINSCNTRQPALWSVIGSPLPDNLASTAVKLGLQETFIELIVTSQLPSEDKGDVGCLHALNMARQSHDKCNENICTDTVRIDAKQNLTSQLDELKMHQCSATYARQMLAKIPTT